MYELLSQLTPLTFDLHLCLLLVAAECVGRHQGVCSGVLWLHSADVQRHVAKVEEGLNPVGRRQRLSVVEPLRL